MRYHVLDGMRYRILNAMGYRVLNGMCYRVLNGTRYRVLVQNALQLHRNFGVPSVFLQRSHSGLTLYMMCYDTIARSLGASTIINCTDHLVQRPPGACTIINRNDHLVYIEYKDHQVHVRLLIVLITQFVLRTKITMCMYDY